MKRLIFLLLLFLLAKAQAQEIHVASGSSKRFENFKSQFVDPRNVDVWLPSNYNPEKKYDVLYMHDGQMLYDSNICWNRQEWHVDETAGKLIAAKKIKEVIIVGIWNTGLYRRSDYFPEKVIQQLPPEIKDTLIQNYLHGRTLADDYLLFLTKELKPFIDSTFNTYKTKEHTFIAGSSMGGLISLYAICEYPAVFSAAACMSTNWPGVVYKCESISPFFVAYLKKNLPDPKQHKIYFDYGSLTLDSLYKPTQVKVDAVMKEKGYTSKNWITKEFPGENHSENAWSKRLHEPFEFLLKE